MSRLRIKSRIVRVFFTTFAVIGGLAIIYLAMRPWLTRRPAVVAGMYVRPDLVLATNWLNVFTPVGEKDWEAEAAVWYLIHSEDTIAYGWLDYMLNYDCMHGMNEYGTGPTGYAIRILAVKKSSRSTEILLDTWFDDFAKEPSNPCLLRGGQAFALRGENAIPLMLELVIDKSLRDIQRGRVIDWLGEMGSEVGPSRYCKEALGCERFGPEIGQEWVGLLIEILETDPAWEVRSEAGRALARIGSPIGIEAIERVIANESEPRHIEFFEDVLEEFVN